MAGDLLTFRSDSEQQTEQLAGQLAALLNQGITIALNGDLGAGKTHFSRSLCAALQADPNQINSPTFVLMQLYTDGSIPVAHFDTYRLADSDEFLAIGADEYLHDPEWICLVEWADRVSDVLPEDRLTITISHCGPEQRQFLIGASGIESATLLRQLKLRLS